MAANIKMLSYKCIDLIFRHEQYTLPHEICRSVRFDCTMLLSVIKVKVHLYEVHLSFASRKEQSITYFIYVVITYILKIAKNKRKTCV